MNPETHKTTEAKESFKSHELPVVRDIGQQLDLLSSRATSDWMNSFNSYCSSEGVSVEIITRRLARANVIEKLDNLYDILIYATADAANTNAALVSKQTRETVSKIKSLAA
jgi:hypothetical protein